MSKYTVYIIKCEEDRIYIGFSEDVAKRLQQHNSGESRWTKGYKNWKLIYSKEFNNITDARRWELYLKKQKGGNGLKKELQNQENL